MTDLKNKNIFEYELPVIIKKDGDGFYAYCPAWKDCYAQGDTVEEASKEIVYVASTLIEHYREEDMAIPLKHSNKFSNSEDQIFVKHSIVANA